MKSFVTRHRSLPKRLLAASFVMLLTFSLVVSPLDQALAAIAYRDSSSANNGAGAASLAINKPTTLYQNDLMVAVVSVAGGTGTTITPPSGWVLINSNDSTTVLKSSTYYKIATASEGASYSFGFSTSQKASGVIVAYSGVDTANPVMTGGNQVNASSTTMTAPTVTTTADNVHIIAVYSSAASTTFTAGSGMTLRNQSASTGSPATTSGIQDIMKTSTGATGTKTMTAGTAAVNIGHNVALTPSGTTYQRDFRVYQNADSTTPGTPLATTNTAAALATPTDAFRIRTGISGRYNFSKISGGDDQTCGISSGRAYCWGLNGNGQLGNNSTSQSTVPVAVDTSGVLSGKTVTDISTGAIHSCAVADGQAYCWGNNGSGRLGNNSTTQSLVPVAVSTAGVLSGKTVTSVVAAYTSSCAIADGQAYCWGAGTYGRLGNNGTAASSVPVAVDTSGVLSGKTVTKISSASDHVCVVASGGAYCWGWNGNFIVGYGAIGDNTQTQRLIPTAVNTAGVLSGKTITDIAAGSYTSCAVGDGAAYCWGVNKNGKLGNGNTTTSLVPVAVSTAGVLSGKTVTAISASWETSCAIADDQAYCWGTGTNGRLGNNATGNSNVPVAVYTSGVLSGKTISTIDAGKEHVCAVVVRNIDCWGMNDNGQLGINSTSQSQVPVDFLWDPTVVLTAPIATSSLSLKLQFAEKTAGNCSAQTGFADITTSTAIAYKDNPSVSNGASIASEANDPIAAASANPQTYQESAGNFTNPNAISLGKTGLWDFSLWDKGAPVSKTYCFKLANSDGSDVTQYQYYPEVTTTRIPGINQQLRGGQSVINGVKQSFIW